MDPSLLLDPGGQAQEPGTSPTAPPPSPLLLCLSIHKPSPARPLPAAVASRVLLARGWAGVDAGVLKGTGASFL